MPTNSNPANLMPGCNPIDVEHARELIGDAKHFGELYPERLVLIRAAIAALHELADPNADRHETAMRMMYPSLRHPWERAVDELAEWLGKGSGLHDSLTYHYLSADDLPAYLKRDSYRGVGLALAYHLPIDQIPPTQFAPYIPYERTPEGMAEQDDRDVQYALMTWPNYVRHQVKPALREEWCTPTVARLAHRLKISAERVQSALARVNRDVAA